MEPALEYAEPAAPGLIIALGQTGLHAAARIHQWRHDSTGAVHVGLIGLDFGPAPEGFPAANFVDRTSADQDSSLRRLLTSQLPRAAQTILVYVLADLGDPCGDPILDVVAATRDLAVQVRQNIAVLCYTVLPDDQADGETQRRAFLTLRDLEQEATAGKPFDAWYCFERDTDSAETLAEIVNVYLGRHANETKRQRMVNVSGRIAHGGAALVGTATIQSLVLPVEVLQRVWALGLAHDTLRGLTDSEADMPTITRLRKSFWTGFPTGSLEWTLFNQRLRIANGVVSKPLDGRVAELDRLFFPTQAMAPQAFTARGLLLRTNSGDGMTGDLAEILSRAESVLQHFSAQGNDNAYLKLITDAVDSHRRLFGDRLRQWVSESLNKNGLNSAQALLSQIAAEILAARAIFDQLRTISPDSDSLTRLRQLKSALLDNPRSRRQRQHLQNFEDGLAAYLDQIRLRILLDQGACLLDSMLVQIDQLQAQVSAWQANLSSIQQTYQTALDQAKVITGSARRRSVFDSPDHPWAQRQRDRYLTRIGGIRGFARRLSWRIAADGESSVNLHLDGQLLQPDTLQDALIARATEVFREASSELDLLAYLNSLSPEVIASEIIPMLQGAEQSSLRLIDCADTLQTASGTLFMPPAERQQDRRTLKRVEAELRKTRHIPLNDNQLIHREIHGDSWRITYLVVTEFVKLRIEVKRYAELVERVAERSIFEPLP